MFRTDANYNLYYDGVVSEDLENNFRALLNEYQLSGEFSGLLKTHHNFRLYNFYSEHHRLIWIPCKILGTFTITIFLMKMNIHQDVNIN